MYHEKFDGVEAEESIAVGPTKRADSAEEVPEVAYRAVEYRVENRRGEWRVELSPRFGIHQLESGTRYAPDWWRVEVEFPSGRSGSLKYDELESARETVREIAVDIREDRFAEQLPGTSDESTSEQE